MTEFLKNNEHVFVAILVLAVAAILVVACFNFVKSNKIVKSLLVNRFKIVDMNEKTSDDVEPMYTIIVSNNSLNAVSVASIGFEHKGDFFNYRAECKRQLDNKNADLVILPRGSVKLRLSKQELEKAVFATSKTKHLGKVKGYIVGLGGETYSCKAKIITKKMSESYKEFYALHEAEILLKFVVFCDNKLKAGGKLNILDKLKYNSWNKRVETQKTAYLNRLKHTEQKAQAEFEKPEITTPDTTSESVSEVAVTEENHETILD